MDLDFKVRGFIGFRDLGFWVQGLGVGRKENGLCRV